jgi:hypothetical protein
MRATLAVSGVLEPWRLTAAAYLMPASLVDRRLMCWSCVRILGCVLGAGQVD